MIADVERRLTSKYGHLAPERISAAVERARARFEQSPIRDFVPLLVERHARAELTKPRQPAAVPQETVAFSSRVCSGSSSIAPKSTMGQEKTSRSCIVKLQTCSN